MIKENVKMEEEINSKKNKYKQSKKRLDNKVD